jgi:hypothetical protein
MFAKHPRIYDEFSFVNLDRVCGQVMKHAEEKMSSLLFMNDVTASLLN